LEKDTKVKIVPKPPHPPLNFSMVSREAEGQMRLVVFKGIVSRDEMRFLKILKKSHSTFCIGADR
jgi:hypothetical protein